jgi:hypothetical protein
MGKLHNEELSNLYSLSDSFRIIKSKEDEMDRENGMHGEMRNVLHNFY